MAEDYWKPFGDRRLMRDLSNRVLGGVCSGVAKYIGFDPIWLRLLVVFLGYKYPEYTFLGYMLMWLIVPADKSTEAAPRSGCVKTLLVVLIILMTLLSLGLIGGLLTASKMMQWMSNLPAEYFEPGAADGDLDSHDAGETEYLASWGWNVISNSGKAATSVGEYYDGNADYRYLESHDDGGHLVYTAELCDSTLEEGRYSLQASVRAEGKGACIFVRTGASAAAPGQSPLFERLQPIPAHGNTGGGMPGLDGEAHGWTQLIIKDIPLKGGTTIYYGVTTDLALTHRKSDVQWFSACDFELIRQ